nr:EFR1 family ferrodoxin [Muribaculaceae bacterium]
MILYFSGTGNSYYVACELARLLGEPDPVAMLSATPAIRMASSDVIWVFPIYSWGVPPVVVDCMQRFGFTGSGRHWMVCTCGDDIGLAHRQWEMIVNRRGWTPAGCFSVQMPNTYVMLPGFDVDSSEVESRKLRLAPERIAEIAANIKNGDAVVDVVKGTMPWLKTRLVYPGFVRHAMSPKRFNATDACVGCGRCSRECPLSNIKMDASSRPQWGRDCAFCLRCYHTCPVHAIAHGRYTSKKGQYL